MTDVPVALSPMTARDVSAERESIARRGVVVAQAPTLPFGFQSHRHFEVLAHALLEAELHSDLNHTLVQLMPEGGDEGMDVRLCRDGAIVGVVQCKRYKSAIGPEDVLTELVKVLLFSRQAEIPITAGFEYQFWTASSPTKSALNLFADATTWFDGLDDAGWTRLIERAKAKTMTLRGLSLTPGEKDELVAAAKRVHIVHVSPEAITRRLSTYPAVRGMFFRSPDDIAAASQDVLAQMNERRRRHLAVGMRQKRVGAAPFVAPRDLDAGFKRFLDDPAAAFVITGGSGRGKSTWTLRLLERAPVRFEADLIQGEEISQTDESVIDTLARKLVSGRDALASIELATRSVWEWLRTANRLLIIDGLDRAPAGAQTQLSGWIQNSIRLCDEFAGKIVLTSRPETWAPIYTLLEPDVRDAVYQMTTPRDFESAALASHRLTLLDFHDTLRVYEAYGLPPEMHGLKPFRTPGLIATVAEMRRSLGRTDVTRRDLMAKVVERACAEVALGTSGTLGGAQAFLDDFGRLIIQTTDGRAPRSLLAQTAPNGPTVIDSFLKTDLIVETESSLRAEPDEAAEYIASRVLDIEAGIEALSNRNNEPLFVGAFAMAVASLEPADPVRVASIVELLIAGERACREAGVRIITELRDQEPFRETIKMALRSPAYRGVGLFSSNLHDLIQDLRLTTDQRLDLLTELETEEDADDWRHKYWTDPEAVGRFKTPFAHAASAAVRADPRAAINWLVQRSDAQTGRRDVVEGLLLEAGLLEPDAAFEALWPRRHGPLRSALISLRYRLPAAAARFIAARTSDNGPIDRDACDFLWSAATHHHSDGDRSTALALAAAARALLPLATAGEQRVRLKIIPSWTEPLDAEAQSDLMGHWNDIDHHEIWHLVAACPRHTDTLIDRLVAEAGHDGPHRDSLTFIGSSWPDLSLRLDADRLSRLLVNRLVEAIDTARDERLHLFASATEFLLYVDERRAQRDPILTTLARRLASSSDDHVRLYILYYAGSPTRFETPTVEQIAFRDDLMARLVDAETGTNISTLVWKLAESAAERGNAIEHLAPLCRRFDAETVLDHLESRAEDRGHRLWNDLVRHLTDAGVLTAPPESQAVR